MMMLGVYFHPSKVCGALIGQATAMALGHETDVCQKSHSSSLFLLPSLLGSI